MKEIKLSEENKDFFVRVYQVVELIPRGKVTNYGAIAKYLGAARSSRMVGWAMNAAHGKPHIPAHRVVNRLGLLSGAAHFSSPTMMQELLVNEGHVIVENQIQNFKDSLWDPAIELRID
jgi:methylated-DNA-protein-cysteine methyltransferase-like protein